MVKKNKEHWGDIISSLEGDPKPVFAETGKTGGAPVEETNSKEAEAGGSESAESAEERKIPSKISPAKTKSEKNSKLKSASKKRAARPSAARKRPAKKEKDLNFEQTLLDSLDAPETLLDLTVGSDNKKEKKSRRSKKSEEELAEKRIAAEEKKTRAKQKKIADAIVEKAEEPFREIASQIEGRIAELAEEETGKRPAKKVRKTGCRKKSPEPAAKESAENSADDFVWDIGETLEVSWGRAPLRHGSAEAAGNADKQAEEETASPANDVKKKERKSASQGEKLSLEEAQEKFSSVFNEVGASSEEVNTAEPSAAAPTVEDNDFWGIPDEPELEFIGSKAKSAPPAKAAQKSEQRVEPASREEPDAKQVRGSDFASLPQEDADVLGKADTDFDRTDFDRRPGKSRGMRRGEHRSSETEYSDRQQPRQDGGTRLEDEVPFDRSAERPRGRREREFANRRGEDVFASRPEREGDEPPAKHRHERRENESVQNREQEISPRQKKQIADRSARTDSREGERVFPTWQDAIGGVVRGNINRHDNSSKGGGDRRRR